MKALVFRSKDEPLQITDVAVPSPGKGEVLVKLHYAALNHNDILIWKERILDKPSIAGSDGSGIVHSVGEAVDISLVGKEVVINPSLYWGNDERCFGENYEILGEPTNGTLAEYIVIPQEYVHDKPSQLSLKESAAIPLAALTAYRILFTRARLTASDNVLITGIGGGAALYLLQMAVAAGASVYVTSSSEEKIGKAIALGAKGGYNYKEKDWVTKAKQDARGFDVIVDSAGGDGFASLTEVANPAARMVIFGRTAGNINNLRPSVIFNKQLQIMGSVMGTREEFENMLAFYQHYNLHPVLDKEFSLEDITSAVEYMKSGKHFGKVIIQIVKE